MPLTHRRCKESRNEKVGVEIVVKPIDMWRLELCRKVVCNAEGIVMVD